MILRVRKTRGLKPRLPAPLKKPIWPLAHPIPATEVFRVPATEVFRAPATVRQCTPELTVRARRRPAAVCVRRISAVWPAAIVRRSQAGVSGRRKRTRRGAACKGRPLPLGHGCRINLPGTRSRRNLAGTSRRKIRRRGQPQRSRPPDAARSH